MTSSPHSLTLGCVTNYTSHTISFLGKLDSAQDCSIFLCLPILSHIRRYNLILFADTRLPLPFHPCPLAKEHIRDDNLVPTQKRKQLDLWWTAFSSSLSLHTTRARLFIVYCFFYIIFLIHDLVKRIGLLWKLFNEAIEKIKIRLPYQRHHKEKSIVAPTGKKIIASSRTFSKKH